MHAGIITCNRIFQIFTFLQISVESKETKNMLLVESSPRLPPPYTTKCDSVVLFKVSEISLTVNQFY